MQRLYGFVALANIPPEINKERKKHQISIQYVEAIPYFYTMAKLTLVHDILKEENKKF